MRAQGVALQLSLAGAGLVAAYFTWQRGPERSDEEVVVVNVTRNELSKVRYEDSRHWVELERQVDGPEPVIWIREGTREAPLVDAGVAEGDGGLAVSAMPPSPREAAPVRDLRGNEQAKKTFEKFAPLVASRGLGTLSEEKLKDLGLDSNEKKLSVTARGANYSFIAATSAQGVGSPYLKATSDGKVYFFKGGFLADLDFASSRLVDRAVHGFKPDEYDRLLVKAGGPPKEFTATGQKLAPKSSPDTPDEFARNWHDKLWRVVVTETLGRGEQPPGGEPKPELRVDYFSGSTSRGFFEVGKSSAGDFWGRSEHTAGWVKLHSNTAELLAEAQKVAPP